MNDVRFIGRLTKDPQLKVSKTNKVYCTFYLAVPRPKKLQQSADFPRITVFGVQAQSLCQYVKKGDLICIIGRVTTGDYLDEEGKTHLTTDFVADRIEFLNIKSWSQNSAPDVPEAIEAVDSEALEEIPQDEEVPF